MRFCQLKKYFIALVVFLLSLASAGCTASDAKKKFGSDSLYFIALSQLNNGNEKSAYLNLKKCAKKGSYYCARKSMEKLCEIGTLQEKNKACLELLKKYNDAEAVKVAATQFFTSKEYGKVIEITKKSSIEDDSNALIKARLEALKKRNDSSYNVEYWKWFSCRPISTEHYQFFRDVIMPELKEQLSKQNQTENEIELPPVQFAVLFRIELYKRNYTFTYENATKLLDYINSGEIEFTQQFASDIGKACLYGSTEFAKNAAFFKNLAEKNKGTSLEYYFWFYAGRLYEKAKSSTAYACFVSAVNTAANEKQKDNALWYLFNTSLNLSIDSILDCIDKYAKEISDSTYFDDFFETLVTSLIASGKINSFGKLYNLLKDYASNETVAQISYIYGRFLQENLIDIDQTKQIKDNSNIQREIAARNAFTVSLNAGNNPYYNILAAYRLNLPYDEFAEKIFTPVHQNKAGTAGTELKVNRDAEILLEGYAYFGFPELIFPFWQAHYKEISPETSCFIADFLRKCSTGTDDYLDQSLRIITRSSRLGNQKISEKNLMLMYPDNYREYVKESTEKNEIMMYAFYSLIKNESYFNPDIVSSAGAVGLCQLMESTGGEIARRLKYKEYSLEDPKINIEFGSYYLAHLLSRCDDSYLTAFLSYNAGITRVRRWKQSSLSEFGKKTSLPMDLFLETVPYAETRNYGRSLFADTVIYSYLYDENYKDGIYEIVKKLLN